ncbi:MAG TPA: hypothetical protein PK765_01750 [bacterium]|nr:hypothetical protein [bacterium]
MKWSDLETLPSMVAMGAAYLLLEMLAPSPRVRPATESVIERTSFGIGRAVSQAGGTREDAGFRGLANRW